MDWELVKKQRERPEKGPFPGMLFIPLPRVLKERQHVVAPPPIHHFFARLPENPELKVTIKNDGRHVLPVLLAESGEKFAKRLVFNLSLDTLEGSERFSVPLLKFFSLLGRGLPQFAGLVVYSNFDFILLWRQINGWLLVFCDTGKAVTKTRILQFLFGG